MYIEFKPHFTSFFYLQHMYTHVYIVSTSLHFILLSSAHVYTCIYSFNLISPPHTSISSTCIHMYIEFQPHFTSYFYLQHMYTHVYKYIVSTSIHFILLSPEHVHTCIYSFKLTSPHTSISSTCIHMYIYIVSTSLHFILLSPAHVYIYIYIVSTSLHFIILSPAHVYTCIYSFNLTSLHTAISSTCIHFSSFFVAQFTSSSKPVVFFEHCV